MVDNLSLMAAEFLDLTDRLNLSIMTASTYGMASEPSCRLVECFGADVISLLTWRIVYLFLLDSSWLCLVVTASISTLSSATVGAPTKYILIW